MGNMSAEEFKSLINVPRETMDQFICYSELLIKWQKSINLVSKSTLSNMWRRHFFDSAQLFEYIDVKEKPLTILDLGSGAGFPGLVLSIFGAGQVHLVEGVGKKCAFMKQVIQKTGIDAIVHNERIEQMDAFPVDLLTSRACAELEKLLDLTSPFMKADTECLFLKGVKSEQEIERATKKWAFELKKYTSKSEESGMILKLSHLKGR
jgi:16S rRNA (guanine527-N7)-methyltransferase